MLAQQSQSDQPNAGQTLLTSSLPDPTDTLTLSQTLKRSFPEPTKSISLIGFTSHPVWYRFTIGPDTPAGDYFIQVTNWFLDEADLYIQGTGIGLALVNELVQVLGGTVSVTSKVGKGTRFEVILPSPPPPGMPYYPEGETAGAGTADASFSAKIRTLDRISEPLSDRLASKVPPLAQLEGHTPDGGLGGLLLIIDDNDDIRAYVRSVFAGEYQILEAQATFRW